MKTPEDKAFDELALRQGAWGGGYRAKRAMAADKLRDCIHGSLARSCQICDLEAEVEELKAALAQSAQQEPAGYIASMALNDLRDGIYGEVRVYHEELGGSVPIYTTPQQRPWVGLTDGEVTQGLCRTRYALQTAAAWVDGVEWATKQLKEKNT